jgi:hypothetical protein
MNRDEIIKMARESNMDIDNDGSEWGSIITAEPADLERFAALVAEAEREACAKVCDEIRHPWGFSAETPEWCRGTEHCAEAIRARGQA